MKTIAINDNLSGISAPQVGVPWRILVLRLIGNTGKEVLTPEEMKQATKIVAPIEVDKHYILSARPRIMMYDGVCFCQVWINPEMKIVDYSTNVGTEMCASIVGLKADVKRYNKVSLIGTHF